MVATGSRPRPLPLPGAEHLLTSDDILSMTELPASVMFVGAGVIGLELGHVLARAGAAVTLLEAADRPLSNFDGRAVEVLVDATRELGIDVRTGVRVERIELAADGGFIVHGQHAGESLSIEAAAVCNGTGRVANVDTLDLPAAGVPVDKYRVELDPQLRSVHNPNILFAGDVVPGTPQLATLATVEGRAAGANALADGDGTAPDYRVVPQAVFTVPTLASVGKRAADASGDHIDVVDTDMASWLSSKSYAELTAFARIVIDRDADRIVGAHLVGHGAAEVIHTFALAMRYSIPASDLESFVYAYPTFMNDIKYLL